jgi:hypothetical protein
MTTHPSISNATDFPLRLGKELGVRSKTKMQIEVTMFACVVGTLEGLALSLVEE